MWFMVLLVLGVTIFTAPWRVEPGLFWVIAFILGFAVIMALLVTALLGDEFCATLHVYENGIEWRSPLRTKRYFFCQLGRLCIGRQGLNARINRYEFWQNGRAVLKLPLPRYHNLLFMERIFTRSNPWVASVVSDPARFKL